MPQIYLWTSDHYMLTFWIILFLIISVNALVHHVLRTIKICLRGWPPAHLNAIGDFKTEPDELN
jgi:hypothetical protein